MRADVDPKLAFHRKGRSELHRFRWRGERRGRNIRWENMISRSENVECKRCLKYKECKSWPVTQAEGSSKGRLKGLVLVLQQDGGVIG